MRFILSIAAFLCAAPAFADAPEWVRLKSLAYAGTHCRAGTVAAKVVGHDLVTTFDHLGVAAGPGIPLADARKNCQIVYDVEAPAGWSYAIAAVDWATPAQLSSGAMLTFQLAHYYSGAASTLAVRHTQNGPFYGRIEAHMPAAATSRLWSPCGHRRGLNVNMQLRTQVTSPRAWITIPDAIDGPEMRLRLAWRRCDVQ